MNPVQVANGNGWKGHRGRRVERVGGDRRVGEEIIYYDDKTPHCEDSARHKNREPVESSEKKPKKMRGRKYLGMENIFHHILYLIQDLALAAWLNPGIDVSFKNCESVLWYRGDSFMPTKLR